MTITTDAQSGQIRDHFRDDVESLLVREMERMFDTVPFTREFHAGTATDADYYRRHIVEIILRIRLNNEVDAYSLYRMGSRHDRLAQKLARYLEEEYGHDAMFLQDARRLGLSREEALSTPPFFATDLLIGFLYHSIDVDGPMPTMVWNWFVEWYSDRYNERITCKAEEHLGRDVVRGARAHLAFDEDEGHVELMFSTVADVVRSGRDAEKVKQYLVRFVRLVGMYFQELHDATIGGALDETVAA